MQGVLVSVSAVVYTRILVSDRIGECPYHPFSSLYKCKEPPHDNMFLSSHTDNQRLWPKHV